jgi:hypothetical protein
MHIFGRDMNPCTWIKNRRHNLWDDVGLKPIQLEHRKMFNDNLGGCGDYTKTVKRKMEVTLMGKKTVTMQRREVRKMTVARMRKTTTTMKRREVKMVTREKRCKMHNNTQLETVMQHLERREVHIHIINK